MCVVSGGYRLWGDVFVLYICSVEEGGSCILLTTMLSQGQPVVDNITLDFLGIFFVRLSLIRFSVPLDNVCTYPVR